jgi:hypothetical protein
MSAIDKLVDEAMSLVRSAPDRQFQRKEIHHILRDRVRSAIERLEAERDGWRAIAHELLKVAVGEDAGQFELPPIELVANAAGFAPALQKFWADLIEERGRRAYERVIDHAPGRVPCDHCGAAAGERCRTPQGRTFDGFHSMRGREPAQDRTELR